MISLDYARNGGMWATRNVFLLEQIDSLLEEANSPKSLIEVKQVVGKFPWLKDAASDA